VVRVVAAHLQVQREPRGFGERAEEVRHQLGGQAADLGAREGAVEDEIRAPGKIDRGDSSHWVAMACRISGAWT
jgi:hypothetical protein